MSCQYNAKETCADCINHVCDCECLKGPCKGRCKLTKTHKTCNKSKCINYELDPFFLDSDNMLKEI